MCYHYFCAAGPIISRSKSSPQRDARLSREGPEKPSPTTKSLGRKTEAQDRFSRRVFELRISAGSYCFLPWFVCYKRLWNRSNPAPEA